MSKREKIATVISFPVAITCIVLNLTTDYVNKYRILNILMIASFIQVVVFWNEVARKSRKDKDSN